MISKQVPDMFGRIVKDKTFAYHRITTKGSISLVYIYEVDTAKCRVKFINLTDNTLGTCDTRRCKDMIVTSDWSIQRVHDTDGNYAILFDKINGTHHWKNAKTHWDGGEKLLKFMEKNLKIL